MFSFSTDAGLTGSNLTGPHDRIVYVFYRYTEGTPIPSTRRYPSAFEEFQKAVEEMRELALAKRHGGRPPAVLSLAAGARPLPLAPKALAQARAGARPRLARRERLPLRSRPGRAGRL